MGMLIILAFGIYGVILSVMGIMNGSLEYGIGGIVLAIACFAVCAKGFASEKKFKDAQKKYSKDTGEKSRLYLDGILK